MTTLFGPISQPATLQSSGYQPLIETIAPGMTGILASVTVQDEPWYNAMLRTLIYLNLTDAQRNLLIVQGNRAAQGIPAPPIADATSAAATAQAAAIADGLTPKPNLLKTIGWLGAGMTVFNWIF